MLESGSRVDRALKVAVAEMYLQGVSTRRVTKVMERLCGLEVSSTQVSRLSERGIFWVTRAKDNLRCRVCRKRLKRPSGNIIRDDEITLITHKSRTEYPQRLRRVTAWVEVNGEWVTMVFLTNNFEWAASSICDLYRCRWGIEAFFKQIKQTFKVCDFLGHSKHAIRWQLWAANPLFPFLREAVRGIVFKGQKANS